MVIPRIHILLQKGIWKLFFKYLFKKQLISGSMIDQFEKQFSAYIGTKYAIAVSSGRIGLYIILKTLGIKRGDEIILSSYNSIIIKNIIKSTNAMPVFVDIKPDTLNMDTKLIKEKITKRTKAIIALHTEGQPCELDKIINIARKYRLFLIEDCAHSLGSLYQNKMTGSIGDFGFFSFGIGKIINTLGGGIIVTKNKKFADNMRRFINSYNKPNEFILIKKLILTNLLSFLTNPVIFNILLYPVLIIFNLFGKDIIYSFFEDIGMTRINQKNLVKFSNFQALLGLKQLKNLNTCLKKQRYNVGIFFKNINYKKFKFQKSIPNSKSSYLHFTLLSNNRFKLIRNLLWRGIDTQASWMRSCSTKDECPTSDMISEQAIYIPIYSTLTEKDIKHVAHILNNVE